MILALSFSVLPLSSIEVSASSLNTSAILSAARAMCYVTWTAPCTFYTWKGASGYNSVVATDGTKDIRFIQGKTYVGIPYTMNTNVTYNSHPSNRLNADDWNGYVTSHGSTSNYQGTDSMYGRTNHCIVGVDCSGLVQRAYNAAGVNWSGLSTSSISSCANLTCSDSYWSSLQPCDILSKSGHMMLIASSSGSSVTVYEATPAKTQEYTYTLTYLKSSGYNVYRYSGESPSHTVDTSYGYNFTATCYEKHYTLTKNHSTESNHWIDAGDVCTIHEVYTDGCCYLTYPSGSDTRNCYGKISWFNINPTPTPTPTPNPSGDSVISQSWIVDPSNGYYFKLAVWATNCNFIDYYITSELTGECLATNQISTNDTIEFTNSNPQKNGYSFIVSIRPDGKTGCDGEFVTFGRVHMVDFPAQHQPVGCVDILAGGNNNISIAGWCYDPDDTNAQLSLHVYLDDVFITDLISDVERLDVNNAYSISGVHGFSKIISTTQYGTHNVKIYIINIGDGSNELLANQDVIINDDKSHNPTAYVDSCVGGEGIITITGWCYDIDDLSVPLTVHVYVDDKIVEGFSCNQIRDDVNICYGLSGTQIRGFCRTIPFAEAGTHNVKLYAINVGEGSNVLFCTTDVIIKADTTNPVFNSVSVTSQSDYGYLLNVNVTDNSALKSVKAATWTSDNGQDDLLWKDMINNGNNNYSYFVKYSDHNNETDTMYINHIYATDIYDNYMTYAVNYTVDTNPPTIQSCRVISADSDGYTVSISTFDKSSIKSVRVASWVDGNKPANLVYDEMQSKGNNTYEFSVIYATLSSDNSSSLYHSIFQVEDGHGNIATESISYVRKSTTPVQSVIYNNHLYELYDFMDYCSWKNAKTFCEELGGHLATITSEEENNIVKELATMSSKTVCWLGATDEDEEGVWQWVTGETFDYSDWRTGQPDNSNGIQDYLRIGADSKWEDVFGSIDHAIICEYEPLTVTFNSNDGVLDTKEIILPYKSTIDNLPTPIYYGFRFIGWFIDNQGENIISSNYTVTNDLILFAQYEELDVGDINADGKVTTIDRAYLARYLAEWEGYKDICMLLKADFNCDLRVDSDDLLIITRYLAGWDGYAQYFE